ncbi:peptidoglycan DD-metalloendopeptidase family protein [Flavobacteriaceae bacterium R38]|nr:peptidoglycan DD-metalloendopeptidase family protein [Flavobacteriaceae bacterium R38]
MDTTIQIDNKLRILGVSNNELREELTDHYLSEIEERITQGVSEEKAILQTLEQMKNDRLKKMNTAVYFLNHRRKLVFGNLCVLGLILISFYLSGSKKVQSPFQWPVETTYNTITFKFGMPGIINNAKKSHKGIDIRAKKGTPILTPTKAIVKETGTMPDRGLYIVLAHSNSYVTRYFHLSKILVEEGDVLESRQIIGHVGDSGKTTGPHLHYEVIKNDKHLDPITISKQITYN